MHGRVRSVKPPIAAEEAALQKRAATYAELSRILVQRRKLGDHGPETFELIGKMLRSNPDYYTLWNYRKEILLYKCEAEGIPLSQALAHKSDSAYRIPLTSSAEVLQVELALTADCIKKNPKSYGAWYHRQWMITLFEFDVKAELDLCALLLTADQRNFHCWNYRRFVAAISGASAQSEFEFSTLKLNENFSNYSAFHHRSVYITQLALTESNFQHLIMTEFSLVENAIFTEPDDQSAWWYRQFLSTWLKQRDAEGAGVDPEWVRQLLEQQLETLKGLLDVEENCRWAIEAALQTVQMLTERGSEEQGDADRWSSIARELLSRLTGAV